MSRRPTLLLVLTLLVAACTEGADTSTTSSETTTSQAQVTTSPQVTEITQTTTATQATTTQATTTTTGPAVTAVEITVVGGSVDRVERFDLVLDGAVRMVVTADVSDEIHLHGYDLHADVGPGREAVIEFDATIPGVFEVEMEDSGVLIGELQVAP